MSDTSHMSKMNRRDFLRISAISAAGTIVAACIPQAAPVPSVTPADAGEAAGGSVTMNMPSWSGPAPHQLHYAQRIFLDRLFDQSQDGTMTPALAESWEWAPDTTALTFNLRQGVKFHDDVEFTAQDVAATVKVWVSPLTGGSFERFKPIKGVEAYANDETDTIEGVKIVDDYTVTLEFDRPAAGFFAYSAFGRDGVNILPAHVWEPALEQARSGEISLKEYQNPWYWSQEACIGTGSFRYVEGELESFIRLERFDDGWRGQPILDEIIYRNFGREDTQFLAFQRGELDAMSISPQFFEQAEALSNVTFDDFATPYIQVLMFNCFAPDHGVADKVVRQAIAHALDRESINQGLNQGLHEPYTAILQGEWNDPNIPQITYDPEKARQLLEEAGFDFSRELVLGFNYPGDLPRQWMEAFQANLTAVGLKSTIKYVESGGYAEAVRAGEWALWLGAFASHYSPYAVATTLSRSGATNAGQCGSEEIDTLLAEAEATADPAEQKEIFSQIQSIVQDEAYIIPLWRRASRIMYSNRLKGWEENTTAAFAMFGFSGFGAEKWYVEG